MSIKTTKKSYSKKLFFALLLLLVIAITVAWYFFKYKLEKKSEQTFYKAFGISIPNNYSINGIDVSKYQSYIYWTSVKKMKIDGITIDFAFIKATEGSNSTDAMFKRNWQLSKENKITRGAYHFFIATRTGKEQAKNFIKNVKLETGDLPPVLDIEENYDVNISVMKQRIKDCLIALEQYYKVKPIIYSYANFYSDYLADDFSDYPVWIAHYTSNDAPSVTNKWAFWQHSEEGRVDGITEKVDFNVFNGDTSAFNKLLIK